MNVGRPHPVFYLVAMFFGFISGMHSNGSFMPFVWIVVAFIGIRLASGLFKLIWQ